MSDPIQLTVTDQTPISLEITSPDVVQLDIFPAVIVSTGGSGTGTVTSITAGSGLLGGTITSSGTISVDFGTSATQVPAGNHTHAYNTLTGLPTLGTISSQNSNNVGITGGTLENVYVKTGTYNTKVNEATLVYCRNTSTSIDKGDVVYIFGASGVLPTIALADASSETTSARTIGLAAENIGTNSNGYVITQGDLVGVNTNAYNEGDPLYLSADTPGGWTTTLPEAPNHGVYVGTVVKKAGASDGIVFVHINNYQELEELSDVAMSGLTADDILVYNGTVWRNRQLGVTLIDATGTPSASTYLRGDGSWATVSGGGGGDSVTTLNGFTGGITLSAGNDITVTNSNKNITVAYRRNPNRTINLIWDGGTTPVPFNGTNTSGTNVYTSGVGADANHFNSVSCGTGTSATGRSSFATAVGDVIIGTSGALELRAIILMNNLSTSTETYGIGVGLNDALSSNPGTNHCQFYYSHGTNGGKFEIESGNSLGSQSADTGITAAANTWYNMFIQIPAGGTQAKFYIDEVLVGTLNTYPPSTSAGLYQHATILKSNGTTARNLFIDYMELYKEVTR